MDLRLTAILLELTRRKTYSPHPPGYLTQIPPSLLLDLHDCYPIFLLTYPWYAQNQKQTLFSPCAHFYFTLLHSISIIAHIFVECPLMKLRFNSNFQICGQRWQTTLTPYFLLPVKVITLVAVVILNATNYFHLMSFKSGILSECRINLPSTTPYFRLALCAPFHHLSIGHMARMILQLFLITPETVWILLALAYRVSQRSPHFIKYAYRFSMCLQASRLCRSDSFFTRSDISILMRRQSI